MEKNINQITNHAINRLGQDIAYKVLRKAQLPVSKGLKNLYIQGEQGLNYPVIVWTKTHQKRKIEGSIREITGKDQDLMLKLHDLRARNSEIWVLWVDALLGQVLGGSFTEVMRDKEFEGLTYPYTEVTHSGKITYFSIYTLPTIGSIPEDDLSKLKAALFINRSPKGQAPLFI